jgi:hypothetical protein
LHDHHPASQGAAVDRWDRWAQQLVASLLAEELLELGRLVVRSEVEARLATALANGLADGGELAQLLIEDPGVEDLLADDEALTELLDDTEPDEEDGGADEDEDEDDDDDDDDDDDVPAGSFVDVEVPGQRAPVVFDPVGVGLGADAAELTRQAKENADTPKSASGERVAGPLRVTPAFERLLRTCEALAFRAYARADRAGFFLPTTEPTLPLAMVQATERRLGVRLPDDFWAAAAFGIEALGAQGIAAEASDFGEVWTLLDRHAIGDGISEVATAADGKIPGELLAFVDRTELTDDDVDEHGGGYLCVRRAPAETESAQEIEWVCGTVRRRLGFAEFLCERLGVSHAQVSPENEPAVLRRARLV